MNSTRRAVAMFAVTMGSMLLGTWAVLFVLRAADFGSSTVELAFLLGAEALTGLTLVIAGGATVMRRPWGTPLLLVGLGMLLYCTVYSIGVFAARDNIAATGWFVLVSCCTAVASALLVADVTRAGAWSASAVVNR